jgi:hypothetical protein
MFSGIGLEIRVSILLSINERLETIASIIKYQSPPSLIEKPSRFPNVVALVDPEKSFQIPVVQVLYAEHDTETKIRFNSTSVTLDSNHETIQSKINQIITDSTPNPLTPVMRSSPG